jgi:hypothetical protein
MPQRRDTCSCLSTPQRISGKGFGLFSAGSYHLFLLSVPTLNNHARRPYLYIYAHSNELEEVGIISLTGVKVEHNPDMETLFVVSLRLLAFVTVLRGNSHQKRFTFTLFTASNSHAFAAPNEKELQYWISKLDPTRMPQ